MFLLLSFDCLFGGFLNVNGPLRAVWEHTWTDNLGKNFCLKHLTHFSLYLHHLQRRTWFGLDWTRCSRRRRVIRVTVRVYMLTCTQHSQTLLLNVPEMSDLFEFVLVSWSVKTLLFWTRVFCKTHKTFWEMSQYFVSTVDKSVGSKTPANIFTRSFVFCVRK